MNGDQQIRRDCSHRSNPGISMILHGGLFGTTIDHEAECSKHVRNLHGLRHVWSASTRSQQFEGTRPLPMSSMEISFASSRFQGHKSEFEGEHACSRAMSASVIPTRYVAFARSRIQPWKRIFRQLPACWLVIPVQNRCVASNRSFSTGATSGVVGCPVARKCPS